MAWSAAPAPPAGPARAPSPARGRARPRAAPCAAPLPWRDCHVRVAPARGPRPGRAGRRLYLLPDGPAAAHPYRVLAGAMGQRRRWALGRVVLNGRRHTALVRPAGRVLAVHLLHDPAAVRAAAAFAAGLGDGAVGEEE